MESKTVGAAQTKDYPGWARAVRREGLASKRDEHLRGIKDFYDHYSTEIEKWRRRNSGYHRAITSLSKFYIPAGARVLEVGSGPGDLLAALQPRRGVGIDISAEMVRLARAKHPTLEFHEMSAEELDFGDEKFDYIVLSDLTGFLYDIRLVFERLRAVCTPHTRIIITWYSLVWQPILTMAEKLGLKYPQPLVNWTTREDLTNLLYLADFEVVQKRPHILLPKNVPVVSSLLNRFIAPLPLFRALTVTNWMVARPMRLEPERAASISVICPCRNEAGNIQQIVDRLPEMGSHTELILVEGHSKDNTLAECQRVAAANPGKDIKVLVQEGRGKGDAVRLGFAQAKGDILIILDADISVAPEDLVDFYDALVSHKGDFINGCRLVYSMDPQAMRFLNLLGNKFFAFLLSKLMGQPIKDSLCGTKALWRTTYLELAAGRPYFGEFDPFGDFDLLFGAAKLNLKITEIPIRYRQRTYGSTNINRFADGSLLLRMCAKAANKLFFIR